MFYLLYLTSLVPLSHAFTSKKSGPLVENVVTAANKQLTNMSSCPAVEKPLGQTGLYFVPCPTVPRKKVRVTPLGVKPAERCGHGS